MNVINNRNDREIMNTTANKPPLSLSPGPSLRGFTVSLYREHLEEASFLYEQRLTLLDDPELSWRDLAPFEKRFEAHIDALVVGGNLACAVCEQQAIAGDFGELHAAVRVLCRQRRFDLLLTIADEIDAGDKDIRDAVQRALADDIPDEWKDDLMRTFETGHPLLRVILPSVFGYRRIDAVKRMVTSLTEDNHDRCLPIVWALGRVHCLESIDMIERFFLKINDVVLLKTTALALLRLGNCRIIKLLTERCRNEEWPLTLLGLCGSRMDVGFIHSIATTQPSEEALLALGLLGCSVSVKVLITWLDDKKLAESAAWALYLITGAVLFEEVSVPLTDKGDGAENGRLNISTPLSNVPTRRISHRKKEWSEWWSNNENKYKINIRYRNGKPFEPRCLLENLVSDILPRRLRQLAYEELTIRYSIDFPFETEMTTGWQLYSINHCTQIIDTCINNFRAGDWYLGGRVNSGDRCNTAGYIAEQLMRYHS